MTNQSVEGFCPECNRMSELQVRAEAYADAPRQLFDQLDPGEDSLRVGRYSIASCPKCGGVFLHVSAKSEPSGFTYEAMLFPTSNRRHVSGIPERVRRSFLSAQSCFDTGNFEPCVVMCRKCLKTLCVCLGAQNGSLASRLRKLRDSGIIVPQLYEWADALRLVGNDAAHDLDICISKQDAVDSLDFVEAILMYIFTLDQRFRDFQARRQEAKQIESKDPSNKTNAADA